MVIKVLFSMIDSATDYYNAFYLLDLFRKDQEFHHITLNLFLIFGLLLERYFSYLICIKIYLISYGKDRIPFK